MYAANHNIDKYLKPLPGLEVYAAFGNDTDTLIGFYTPNVFRGAALPLTPILGVGDGDQALFSMLSCTRVVNNASRVFTFHGIDHIGIVGLQGGAGSAYGRLIMQALVTGHADSLAPYSLAAHGKKA